MQNKAFCLTYPMNLKMFIFRKIKKGLRVEQVEPRSWKYCSRQKYAVSGTPLLTAFLESDPRLHCFCKLSLPWELGSSLWSSEHAGYKDELVSQGNCTSLSTLNKTFLSTFKFVSKISKFLSKNPSHFTYFYKT